MKDRRRNKHKMACSCRVCQGQDPLAAYIARHQELFKSMMNDETLSAEEQKVIEAGAGLFRAASDVPVLMEGIWAVLGPAVTLPGYLVMGHALAKEKSIEDVDRRFLSLWEVGTQDAGVGQIRQLLAQTNEQRAKNRAQPYDMALWVTGIFAEDWPVHCVVVTKDHGVGFIQAGPVVRSMTAKHMGAALDLLKLQASPLAAMTSHGTSPRENQVLHVLHGAGSMALQLGIKLTALTELQQQMASNFAQEFANQRLQVTSQADEHRKAAISAKNKQLDAANAKVIELSRKLSQAESTLRQQAVCAVQAGDPPPATLPSRHQASAAAEAEAKAVIEAAAAIPDEGDTHWQEMAERQAAALRELRLVINHLQSTALQPVAPDASTVIAAPRKLTDLPNWVAENSDRVIVLKRAIQAARKSDYEDDEFVYQALDMLATTYRDVKLGLADRMAYAKACEGLGLDMGGSVDIQVSDDYFFQWQGRRRFLDQHIGRGNSRDPRYCFRAYFTWDAKEAKVIIGWLPSHLPTKWT